MSMKQCPPPRPPLLAMAGLLCALVFAQTAAAECRLNDPSRYVPQNVALDMGRLVIPPNLGVGAVIGERVVQIDRRANVGRCDPFSGGKGYGIFARAAQQTPVAGFANVYPTDVAGVGIRIRQGSDIYPYTVGFDWLATDVTIHQNTLRVELIKTAQQTGSGLISSNGTFVSFYLGGNSAALPALLASFMSTGTTVVSPTCTVNTGSRNVAVVFGDVSKGSFSGIGTHAANRDFDIQLTCQGSSQAALQSTIAVRLDAEQDGSGMPGVLKLSAGSSVAQRIGIQMVLRTGNGEGEVQFGKAVRLGATVPGSNTMSLPLRARYVQTQPGTVIGGVANGQATFTIQYE
jgi:type 1 fimbria pilin